MTKIHPQATNVQEKKVLFFDPHRVDFQVDDKQYKWRSRQHRKGKSSALVTEKDERRKRGFRLVKLYDISWWTAFLFLIGSIIWVINGVFVFHVPIKDEYENYVASSTTSFLGGAFFFFGGWAMYWEGLNMEETVLFDEAIRQGEKSFLKATNRICCPSCLREMSAKVDGEENLKWKWIGWGNTKDLGYMADFLQFLGTQIFFIAVLAFLPGILPEDEASYRTLYIIFFWIPQVIGAGLLTMSSYLIMLESQENLWKIEPLSIGWHVGFWNVLGSVGFLLSGIFGIVYPPSDLHDRQYGVSLTTYLGGFFFLIGTIFQCYEACQ